MFCNQRVWVSILQFTGAYLIVSLLLFFPQLTFEGKIQVINRNYPLNIVPLVNNIGITKNVGTVYVFLCTHLSAHTF